MSADIYLRYGLGYTVRTQQTCILYWRECNHSHCICRFPPLFLTLLNHLHTSAGRWQVIIIIIIMLKDLEGRESDQQVDRQPSTVPRQMDEVFMTAGNAGLKETLRIHLNAAECVFFYCSSL
ncbi:hypothetical protein BDBG_03476 [Blastomyces gilchristii SLH14081]|uniref:Uncharacterized protein n=1 Tax=Blastomyces gilchristii (strain SLH14081) TaxID=559298 RepID=A0A179UHE7_BLAGS|nr:uncharacterized protein BDBG_03476 [Blastomyces gilchristii SLH14081]OAT07414.1 hypothetical protein BDBG_03476 [Blastomyces gilchristii SLH14081]